MLGNPRGRKPRRVRLAVELDGALWRLKDLGGGGNAHAHLTWAGDDDASHGGGAVIEGGEAAYRAVMARYTLAGTMSAATACDREMRISSTGVHDLSS